MSGLVLVNESYIRERPSNTHLAEDKSGIFLEAAMCMSASSAGVRFARWRQSPLGATVSSIHLVACDLGILDLDTISQTLSIALPCGHPLRSGRPELLSAFCGGLIISLTLNGCFFDSKLQGYCLSYHHEIMR